MEFPCPACNRRLRGSLEGWALRCPGCRQLVRSRALEGGAVRAYEVEVVGQPGTRRVVEVPWRDEDSRRLGRWLALSSIVTLGLIGVLYLLARWLG